MAKKSPQASNAEAKLGPFLGLDPSQLARIDRLADCDPVPASTAGLPPDPEERNDERAEWAQSAINAFRIATGTDPEDAVSDLLADLMHWCDRYGPGFHNELNRARNHYDAETDPGEAG